MIHKRLYRASQVVALALLGVVSSSDSYAITPANYPALATLIEELVKEDGFDQQALGALFEQVELRPKINQSMARPAEKKMTWPHYRKLFLTPARIGQGLTFWRQHSETLARAERHYGVPAAVIVAIIGIESRYGAHAGSHKVLESLSTLAFTGATRRRAFFTAELKALLLLSREEQVTPLTLTGSYAGAMGIPQFIPSSYRHYAVDFDDDGKRDLWQNPADAIGSVANYFHEHRWHPGEPVLHPITAASEATSTLPEGAVKPHTPLTKFVASGYQLQGLSETDLSALASLIKLSSAEGDEYYAIRHNFYVITRYNRAIFYAMVVHQLSEALDSGHRSALQRP